MRASSRWSRAALVAGVLGLGCALVPTVPASAASRADSGPDAATVARTLVARRQGAALVVALLGPEGAVGAARSAATDARNAVERAETEAATAADALRAAETARAAAGAEVEASTRLLGAVAVEAYQLAHTDADSTLPLPDTFERTVAGTTYAAAAQRSLSTRLAAARAVADDAAAGLAAAQAESDRRRAGISPARREAGTAEDFAVAVEAAARSWAPPTPSVAPGSPGTTAVAGPAPTPAAPPGAVPGSMLSIMGPSLLRAEDLAAAVKAHGGAHPSLDIDALARDFIEEGRAEGVRGDLAFAQAVVETGWFSFAHSMVAPGDNNFAGIGACDSCANGHRFPSPRSGVRAQIQLLRTYAQPGLTTDMLASPPAGRAPEVVHVRGCCSTWGSLSGVWATDRAYSGSIMAVYDRLVVAAARR